MIISSILKQITFVDSFSNEDEYGNTQVLTDMGNWCTDIDAIKAIKLAYAEGRKDAAQEIFTELDRIRMFKGVNTASKIYEYNKLKNKFIPKEKT